MTDFVNTPPLLSRHTLLRAGCPLHYWVGGQAGRPLIAFLHGATMDHRMFNAQVEALTPHTRVLTWDGRRADRSGAEEPGVGLNAQGGISKWQA